MLKARSQRKGIERVLVRNGQYAFSIARRADTPDARFAIEWLEPEGSDPAADAQINEEAMRVYGVINAAWMSNAGMFSDWWTDEAFKITGVSVIDETPDELIRVDFEYVPSDPGRARETRSPAYIIFDASRSWAIREVWMGVWFGSQYSVYEYANGTDNQPILRQFKNIIEGRNDDKAETIITFENVRREATPEEEFKLSFYGLPEPNFMQMNPRFSLMIYVNIAVICFAIAFVAWRRSRRRPARVHSIF